MGMYREWGKERQWKGYANQGVDPRVFLAPCPSGARHGLLDDLSKSPKSEFRWEKAWIIIWKFFKIALKLTSPL